MPVRLPIPGQDNNTWGDILNNYLLIAHSDTGELRVNSVGASQIQNSSITESKLHPDVITQLQSVGITPSDQAKLDGIASGATANASDAQLRDRTTHTGTQPITTITNLQTELNAKASTADVTSGLATKADTADLATVATSGNYNDLTNRPTIPAAQVNADWNASTGAAQILNKPTIPDVSGFATTAALTSGLSGKADVAVLSELVPSSRTISGKPLTTDVTLNASDVGALPSSFSITEPAEQTWANVTIADDGSSSSSWPDRFRVVFAPQAGTSRTTFWLNEYGEFRGMPGKDNTVAGRFFAALDTAGYAARSSTVPVLEVTDQRNGTRTTIFGVYKGGRVTMTRLEANETRTAPATAPWITENIDYVLSTDDSDHLRILVQGVTRFWMNEWGAIRGTAPYNWGDALVRAIRQSGDGISDGTGVAGSGRALELVDRRVTAPATITTTEHSTPSNVMWGVRWKDGRMVQGGALVGAVYTLEAGQDENDIPESLPAGTLIVRKSP